MAVETIKTLARVLGLVTWGDLAETTIYRTKRKKMVVFSKTYPKKPPSPAQVVQRLQFKYAANAWRQLTQAKQEQWDLATRRASLPMHGYDLFVSDYLLPDPIALATLARQTNTDIP